MDHSKQSNWRQLRRQHRPHREVQPNGDSELRRPKQLLQFAARRSDRRETRRRPPTSTRLDQRSGHEADLLLRKDQLGFQLQDRSQCSVILLHQ
jgi:hypothetical protein